MREKAHARAAEFFGHRNAEQTHVAELFPQVGGKRIFAIDQIGARADLFVRKAADGFAKEIDFFTEGKRAHAQSQRVDESNDSASPAR